MHAFTSLCSSLWMWCDYLFKVLPWWWWLQPGIIRWNKPFSLISGFFFRVFYQSRNEIRNLRTSHEPLPHCISCFSQCCGRTPNKTSVKMKGIILIYFGWRFDGAQHMVRGMWRERVAGIPYLLSNEEWKRNVGAQWTASLLPFYFYSAEDPTPWNRE